MGDTLIRLLVPLLLGAVYLIVIYSYLLDSLSTAAMLIYSIISALLFLLACWSPRTRWRSLLFFLASFTAALMLYDAALVKQIAIFIAISTLLYILTPHMTLSSEAAALYADIRHFRKQIRKQGIPSHLPETELDKWAVRSLILKAGQRHSLSAETTAKTNAFSAAPLAFLLSVDHDPVSYLEDTWKWSKIASSDSSPGSSSSDGGGFFSSDGGGGGDSGGGGGAD